jgi:aquaporin Z
MVTNQVKKLLAEFLGTFALVLCGTGAIVLDGFSNGTIGVGGIALSFGLIVWAMIFTFLDTSGAHINPAVTLALMFNKQCRLIKGFAYMFVQFAGGIAASLLLLKIFGAEHGLGQTNPSGSDMQSFFLEFVLTLILMLVILKVSGFNSGKGFTAIAVGSVVLLEAYFAGPISGASMNPARSLGPAVVAGDISNLWIYLVATNLGALAAIPVHHLTSSKKHRYYG